MAETSFDIAVFGSGLVAAVLAGCLARRHGQRVCLVADGAERHRLTRDFTLSIPAAARPETWALLAAALPEAERLHTEIADHVVFERVTPVIAARHAGGRALLGHMRHLAAGFGVPAQRLVEAWLPGDAEALRFADALRLRRHTLRAATGPWLESQGVRIVDWIGLDIAIDGETGAARIAAADETIVAGRAVLADDDAILALADPEVVDRHFRRIVSTALLSEPGPPLPAPLLFWPEYGLIARQRANGAVEAIVDAPPDRAVALLARLVPAPAPLRRAGFVSYPRLLTHDGAPLIGAEAPGRPVMIAGLGTMGPLLVPALARLVAGDPVGSADPADPAGARDWLAARAPSPNGFRPVVAEFRAEFPDPVGSDPGSTDPGSTDPRSADPGSEAVA